MVSRILPLRGDHLFRASWPEEPKSSCKHKVSASNNLCRTYYHMDHAIDFRRIRNQYEGAYRVRETCQNGVWMAWETRQEYKNRSRLSFFELSRRP